MQAGELRTTPLSTQMLVGVCLFAIAVCFLYVEGIRGILANLSYADGGFWDAIANYREVVILSSKGRLEGDYGKIPLLASVGFRALEVVSVYVVANYLFLPKNVRTRQLRRYAPAFLVVCLVLFLSGGSRSPIVHFAIAAIVIAAVRFDKEPHQRITLQAAVRLALVAVILLALFALLSFVRGEELRQGLLGYLSFFLGSGVASFGYAFDGDMLWQLSEPFQALDSLIGKVVPLPADEGLAPLWIDFEGNSSNVFTAFSSFYAHYGVGGVLSYCILLALVMTWLYSRAYYAEQLNWVVAYGFFGYVLFDSIRADALSSLVGVPLSEYVVLLWIVPKVFEGLANPHRLGVAMQRRAFRMPAEGRESCG